MWSSVYESGDFFVKSLSSASWKILAPLTFVSYVCLCSALRFRRVNGLRSKYGFKDRKSLSRMTNEEAYEISRAITVYEFPMLYNLSLHFGGLKTFCINNIASLLNAVSSITKPGQASKRYEDVQIFYGCISKFSVGSVALSQAIGRINYLHSPYIKSGGILNQDLLYVLCASLAAPIRFIKLFEWRELEDMELAALGTFWKYIAEMMDIDFKSELGKDEWADGVELVEDLTAWAAKYELEHMEASPDVQKLGKILVELLLSAYPKFLQPTIQGAVLVLMGDRLRQNFGLPEPGLTAQVWTPAVLMLRKLFLRYLALPRLQPFQDISDVDAVTGRVNQYTYLKDPWYVRSSVWSRWGPVALVRRAFGLHNPGDGGSELMPEGFRFVDIGPKRKLGKGIEESNRLSGVAYTKASANACPFAHSLAT